MAHTVPSGPPELDDPTIGVTDLLLSKLQIHEITENDLIDTVVLLADHDLGAGDREHRRRARRVLMSKDGGSVHDEATWRSSRRPSRYEALPPRQGDGRRPPRPPKTASTTRRRAAEAPRGSAPARWYEEVEVHR